MNPDEHTDPEPTDDETHATGSPPVTDPLLKATEEADADDPTIGGSSDGDT